MLRNVNLPQPMKNFCRVFVAALCAMAGMAFADDFKSEVIPSSGSCSACPIRVHGNQFMLIRNFTQDGISTSRGVVMVSTDGGSTWVDVLSAAILKTSTATPEVINSVVVAGPADVSVKCGTTSGNCFISFKKDGS